MSSVQGRLFEKERRGEGETEKQRLDEGNALH